MKKEEERGRRRRRGGRQILYQEEEGSPLQGTSSVLPPSHPIQRKKCLHKEGEGGGKASLPLHACGRRRRRFLTRVINAINKEGGRR